jgi:outer membrane protein, multidrug efflux system
MSKVDRYGQSINIKKQQLQSLDSSVDSATSFFKTLVPIKRDLQFAKIATIEIKNSSQPT